MYSLGLHPTHSQPQDHNNEQTLLTLKQEQTYFVKLPSVYFLINRSLIHTQANPGNFFGPSEVLCMLQTFLISTDLRS